MTAKQNWLLKRLLIPTGILPPGIKYEDLSIGLEMIKDIGNVGVEYFYTVSQDDQKVVNSPIGGKIFAMHAPWPMFGPIEKLPQPLRYMGYKLYFGKTRLPISFEPMAQKSFEFAKKIGAKVVTIHATFFDHQNLEENLGILADLEEKFDITTAIEHEGNYLLTGRYYDLSKLKKFNGTFDWLIDPRTMINQIDKIYPRKKFKICFDTASQINSKIPLAKSTNDVFERIAHVHLASNPEHINDDLAWEIDRDDIVEVARILYQRKYNGYITAEVAAYVGEHEERVAKIYAVASILRIPILKKTVVGYTKKHLTNSCRYLLDHIDD